MTDFSYIGSGKVYLRKVGAAAPRLFVGNVSSLGFNIAESPIELKDYTKPGGGTYNEVRRIDSVEASLTMHDLSGDNLATALFGNTGAISVTPITDEVQTLYLGGLVRTALPINTAVAPVVNAQNGTDAVTRADTTAYDLGDFLVPATPNGFYYEVTTAGTSAGTPPTFPTTVGATVADGTAVLTCMGRVLLTLNTDYTVSGGGIYIEEAAAATDGEPLEIDYTPAAGSVVEALLNSAQEYELVFDGLNEARSGKPVIIEAYRVKFGPAANLPLIGDEYAALELTGKVLKDSTKNGTSVSQYFKVEVVT